MAQHEEEWKDRCAALRELRRLLRGFEGGNQAEDAQAEAAGALFAPENLQALTQPFRSTLTDLRSAVVKEACAALADLAQTLGPVKSKIIVRDLFPTLVDARGTGNKVQDDVYHEESCWWCCFDGVDGRGVGEYWCRARVHQEHCRGGAQSPRARPYSAGTHDQQVRSSGVAVMN